ncbi:hypothetical protein S7711_08000 [Stachybotrys chartarum IBT 7711]|uniref:Uncharacterized protein n=1 Tax=Stachybotrys chartarum (strain CBS 109288 / IBT 7711) TaxID=1280523 RepID=A0A084AFC5_STACB|nr:hypothetical protein S7711_08000 [Stachybotrys chartarum IBT 7711]
MGTSSNLSPKDISAGIELHSSSRGNELPSLLPSSYSMNRTRLKAAVSGSFTHMDGDLSEADLTKGFRWQPQQKPRPGQFSERPRRAGNILHEKAAYEENVHNNTKEAALYSNKPEGQQILRSNKLFHLPELCLAGTPATTDSNFFAENAQAALVASSGNRKTHATSDSNAGAQIPADNYVQLHHSQNSWLSQNSRTGEKAKSPSRNTLDLPSVDSIAMSRSSFYKPDDSTQSPASESRQSEIAQANPILSASTGRRDSQMKRPVSNSAGKTGLAHHRSGSMNTCGDLEGPILQTPLKRSCLSREGERAGVSSRAKVTGHEHRAREAPGQRSHSRTSNISKKRSAKRRSCQQPRVELKKEAIQHVAHNWNLFMKIANEEENQACAEIDKLVAQISKYESDLLQSRTSHDEKDDALRRTSAKCEILGKSHDQIREERDRLVDEVQTLHEEVSGLRQRTALWGDKYASIKARVNEAVAEQLDFYQRHQESLKTRDSDLRQLKETNDKQTTALADANRAVEEAQLRYGEMAKRIGEVRGQTEHALCQKDETIADLASALQACKIELIQEHARAEEMCSRVESQENMKQMAHSLDDKLAGIVELCAQNGLRHCENLAENRKLQEILANLVHQQEALADDKSTPPCTIEMLDELKTTILACIQSEMTGFADRQSQALEYIDDVVARLQLGLGEVASQVHTEMQSGSHVDSGIREEGRKITEVCEAISIDVRRSHEMFEKIEEHFSSHSVSKEQVQALHDSQHAVFIQQLKERQSHITSLEQQIHFLREDYLENISSMMNKMHNNDQAMEEQLHVLGAELRSRLDDGFKRERLRSEQTLQASDEIKNVLEVQLQEARQKLEELGTASQVIIEQSSQQKHEESKILLQKVQQFEQEAAGTHQLRERWTKDIEAIDALRSQLTSIFEKVPDLIDFETKLEQIGSINSHIHSTASYLAAERLWVQNQLKPQEDDMVEGEDAQDSISPMGAGDRQFQDLQGPLSASSVVDLERPTAIRGLATGMAKICIQEQARRKVTVQSPAMNSPSPPPSIEQEQLRRREAIKPRSILKITATSTVEAAGPTENFLRVSQNHSQYNRPVMGEDCSKTVGVNNAMAEQIRSTLIHPTQPPKEWDLPRVADFEEGYQSFNACEASVAKREMSNSGVDDDGACKRRKLDSDPTDSTGLLRVVAVRSQLPAQRPVKRTYSRKNGDIKNEGISFSEMALAQSST